MSFVVLFLGGSAWAGGQSGGGVVNSPVPQYYRLSYILCATKAACDGALRRLHAGEPFAQVAQQVSIDGATRNRGGQIRGWERAESYTANFAAEVRRLKVGEVSEQPVQTEFGWCVLRVDQVSETPERE